MNTDKNRLNPSTTGASSHPEQAVPNQQPTSRRGDVPLGNLYATRNASEQIPLDVMLTALHRHSSGDWGEVGPEDWQENDHAIKTGERLLSAYISPGGTRFLIITERDRSTTTILLPQDY